MLENLSPYIEIFNKVNKERLDKSYAFYRNIITIVAGFIAILVSLKSHAGNPNNHCIKILFTSTISLMSLGILAGIILLSEEVSDLGRQENQIQEYIGSRISGKGTDNYLFVATSHSKTYKASKFIFTVSLISSLITLIFYSYLA